MWYLRSLHIPGLAHFPGESGIRGSRLHSRPGAQLPAVYVGGQKQLPQDSPSCFKPKGMTSLKREDLVIKCKVIGMLDHCVYMLTIMT